MKRILITGGAGFIGHHLCEHFLVNTDWSIVLLDKLDHFGNLNRLAHLDRSRIKFVYHDLRAPIGAQLAGQLGEIGKIFHLGAATHVDRSISEPLSFVYDNVIGTANLLEYARISSVPFYFFGTDEVFGPAPEGVSYREWDRYRSGNPYAATKAGAEELCIAYANTYHLPVVISHCMNVFGERQHPEKFIPNTIRKVMNGETVTIHADASKTIPGSRYYIHARNVGAAILFLTDNAQMGEKYNIVGEREVSNLELAELIAKAVGKPLLYELVDFHSSRPGHDLRYALNGEKMSQIGWKLPVSFEVSLEKTIKWTIVNHEWLCG